MQDFRSQFQFTQECNKIFLDSAATTQKPKIVLNRINDYLQFIANPGRNPFGKSQNIFNQIQDARKTISDFFNTKENNLAFTAGVTDGMNKLALSLGSYFKDQDSEILICNQDHKSTTLPWVELAKKNPNIKIHKYNLHPFTGEIDEKDLLSKITSNTKLIVFTHSHNIFGVVNNIKSIVQKIPKNILTVLDSAQTVSHIKVDFKSLGVDYLLFSGHKLFALEGSGALISSQKGQKHLKQVFHGGGVEDLNYPNIFEVGTPNTAGILSMQSAIEFIKGYGIQNIHKKVTDLTTYCIQELSKLPGITFTPGVAYNKKSQNTGIISFKIDSELEQIIEVLDHENINIRIGTHCSSDNQFDATLRVSLHAYNEKQDIDKLIQTLGKL